MNSFSTVILLLPLIQEGCESVQVKVCGRSTGKRLRFISQAYQEKVW